ncbi:BgTH12-06871 [Blumeria graminis f. sp. triticale]|uniref:BgTH12-06871 n=1 Tax=Blumeria graminis f. sp. triticale TaxID=1689686 RepID=A0A9W4D8F2_BLUGR|nr:BgTH12-06871 [Blumeria graminis f. sp. triticale]
MLHVRDITTWLRTIGSAMQTQMYLAAAASPRRLNASWNVLSPARVFPQFQILLAIRQNSI